MEMRCLLLFHIAFFNIFHKHFMVWEVLAFVSGSIDHFWRFTVLCILYPSLFMTDKLCVHHRIILPRSTSFLIIRSKVLSRFSTTNKHRSKISYPLWRSPKTHGPDTRVPITFCAAHCVFLSSVPSHYNFGFPSFGSNIATAKTTTVVFTFSFEQPTGRFELLRLFRL